MERNRRRSRTAAIFAVSLLAACVWIPAGSAHAQTRSFYMTLFGGERPWYSGRDARYNDFSWFVARSVHLGEGRVKDPQPSGKSILSINEIYDDSLIASMSSPDMFESALLSYGYDWSAIAAVVIDEPFWTRLNRHEVVTNWANPCNSSRPWMQGIVSDTAAYLNNAYQAVKRISPSTRFWVNFAEPEVQWMMSAAGSCAGVVRNRDIFEVISLDIYKRGFDQQPATGLTVRGYYQWLLNHRASPSQQLALVPGLFYVKEPAGGQPYPSTVALWLYEYLAYAHQTNLVCSNDARRTSLGNVNSDCPIWLVAGWGAFQATITSGSEEWAFLFDPQATLILEIWKSEIGLPMRVAAALPAIVRAGMR